MDNITHTLIGVMLSRAGLNRHAPRATWTLVLAANAPDLDVIASLWGSITYLEYHRGLTHSLSGIPMMAAVTALVMRGVALARGDRFSWRATFRLSCLGVATHPLLDFTNTYGIRPWLPFNGSWYSWDIAYIVDLWLWVALVLCWAVPALGRLISGEIGARPGDGRAPAAAALLFVIAWWGARDLFHRRAVLLLQAHMYGSDGDRAPPLRTAAFPNPVNPLAWRGFVETERFYQVVPLNVLEPADPNRGQILYKPESSPELDAARRTRTAQVFARFARYEVAMVDRREDGYEVTLTDLRFAEERRNAFVCTILLDSNRNVVRESFSF